MRTALIVIGEPIIGGLAGFVDVGEAVRIEEFVAQAAVERLDLTEAI